MSKGGAQPICICGKPVDAIGSSCSKKCEEEHKAKLARMKKWISPRRK